MTIRVPRAQLLWALLSLPLAAGPLAATSYVPMSDEDLVDQAPVAAVVTVHSAEPSPADIATDYVVEVEEVLKGSLAGSSVVVRVPGVERADGMSLRLWGAPRFAAGERALLMLAPRPDGSYAVDHSAAVFLVDPDGRVAALFGTPHEAGAIARDYRRIVAAR